MSNENDVLRQLLSEESRDHAREAEAAAIEEAAQVEALYAIVSAEEQQYEDLKALVVACTKLIANADFRLGGGLGADSSHRDAPSNAISNVRARDLLRVREALEVAEVWFDDNDPRSMGWVNDRGLP